MSRTASRLLVALVAAFLATGGSALTPARVAAASPHVVVSQVYGGGGNTNATYTHDFIELFNRGTASQSLAGWSVQYASATGTGNLGANSGQLTELPAVSLAPGQYLLIQEASTAAVGSPLPTPDVTDATPINMSGTAGKVAVVDQATTLGCNGGSTPCTAAQLGHIIDLVGYGTGTSGANFYEGAGPAPTISASLADFRGNGGCTDTDNNGADFASATPGPRTTASPTHSCPVIPTLSIDDVSLAEGDLGGTDFTFTISLSAAAGAGGVTFDVATSDNTATVGDGDYLGSSSIGQTIPAGETTSTFNVQVGGDPNPEPNETFFVDVTNVTGAVVLDGHGVGTILDDDDACGLPFTPIYDIQGSGTAADITGDVITEGVVVGDFEGPTSAGLQGFYIQDADGDGDAATSDGIFVFTGDDDNGVEPGDLVRVSGFARERFNETALNGTNSNTSPVTSIVECGTDTVVATDVEMPFSSNTYLERFEGMLVRFTQDLVISEYFNYEQFGEIVIALPLDGESRPFTGTAIDEPKVGTSFPANERTLANSLRRITLDDGLAVSNPTSVRHPNGAPFSLANKFRGGDHVANATGVLGFAFSLYRIQPTEPADYTATNPRPAPLEDVEGRLTVAAMNTLNFFLTLDYPTGNPLDNKCGPLKNVECRGADFGDTAGDPIVDDEFQRQRDKLLQALVGLDADVLGLNELENTTDVDPLGDPTNGIVPGLNGMLGDGTYAAINTGVIGTDAIRVGLIYKPAIVTPVGPFKILTTAVDPRFIDTKSRPALAQTFQEIATGERFTVVVNHLKSKGSNCNDVGDPDAGDGQGNCNGTRTLAAQALVDWLANDPTGSGDPDFLIMGDLNSYAMEDPIDAVKAGPDNLVGTADDYTNLIAQYQGPYAYSYTFDGQAGYLDHALAGATLVGQTTGAADWHINSDEPDLLDYDVSFKPQSIDEIYESNEYRTSDHDPVRVGLALNAPPTFAITPGGTCSPTTVAGTFLLTVGDLQTAPGSLALSLTGNTNTTLVPNGNVSLGGSGANRTIGIAAANKQSGTGTLTFSLSDGVNVVSFSINVQVGTDADESFTGTAAVDLILGLAGNDSLSGLGGPDLLCGGNGQDTVAGGDGDDTLDGMRGNDSLSGEGGSDVIRGDFGNDSLFGGLGDDLLTGGMGADGFSGGAGSDTLADLTPSQGDTWDGT